MKLNIWDNFGSNAVTTYAQTQAIPLYYATAWIELAAGITIRMSERFSLYSEWDYSHSVAQPIKNLYAIQGNIGLRAVW